jgi:predicted TIM-barrel fold metal-dependent hydrolase
MTMKFADAWVNVPTKRDVASEDDPLTSNVAKWFHRQMKDMDAGFTSDDLVKMMDANGVEKTVLSAKTPWMEPGNRPRNRFQSTGGMSDAVFDQYCAELAADCEKHKGRLFGSAIIDPLGVSRAYRQLERSIKEYGFVAARVFPAQPGLPLDDPLYYPVYAKCVELGVPVTINLGVPGPMRPARLQRPMLLDDILLAFPELTVIGTHIGHPWHLETLALLQKHDNFFLMTSGWAPKYIPTEILHFMNTRGKNKVMWASDYPLVSIERAVADVDDLPLSDEAKARYAYDNCIEAFGLA